MNQALSTTSVLLCAGLLALALPRASATGAAAPAPPPQEGAAVVAEGVGVAPLDGPSTLHLRVRVEATAEVAAETLTDFLEARRRAVEAFTSLGIEGLEVVGRGLEAEHRAPLEAGNDMGIVMMGMSSGTFEGVRYREELDVRVPGFGALEDEARRALLGLVLDAGLDAGAAPISTPDDPQAAMFLRLYGGEEATAERPMAALVADGRGPEDAALAAAFADALARARALAGHAGRALGEVQRLEVLSVDAEPGAVTSGGVVRAVVKVGWHLR